MDMITFGTTPSERKLEGKFIPTICSRDQHKSRHRDESEGKRVKRVCEFWDERYGKNRSITDIDWSPKVKIFFAICIVFKLSFY